MNDQTVLRVTGHACLETRADAVRFTVTVHRCATTPALARRAGFAGIAAVERVLARHALVVIDQEHSVLTVVEHGEEAPEFCGRAELSVTVGASDPLSALVVALRRVKGVEVGEVTYLLRDPEKLRQLTRKSAVADAAAAARAAAESLNLEVRHLDRIADTGAPQAPTGTGPTLRTECTVTAQYTLAPAAAGPPTG